MAVPLPMDIRASLEHFARMVQEHAVEGPEAMFVWWLAAALSRPGGACLPHRIVPELGFGLEEFRDVEGALGAGLWGRFGGRPVRFLNRGEKLEFSHDLAVLNDGAIHARSFGRDINLTARVLFEVKSLNSSTAVDIGAVKWDLRVLALADAWQQTILRTAMCPVMVVVATKPRIRGSVDAAARSRAAGDWHRRLVDDPPVQGVWLMTVLPTETLLSALG